LSVVIKEAKKLNYAEKITLSCNKNKTIWDIVKHENNKAVNNERINYLSVEGNIIKIRQDIVNIFNKYFLSTAKNINPILTNRSNYNPINTTPLHYLLQAFKTPFPKFHFKHISTKEVENIIISTKEVENIIKSLKPKNSSGYDGIPTKLLKVSSAFILSPLTYTCNKSISSGIFPDHLKYAMVKPLHKKGDIKRF
jgi:hypothetical protein